MTVEQANKFAEIYDLKDTHRVHPTLFAVGEHVSIIEQNPHDYAPTCLRLFFLYEPEDGEPCSTVFHRYCLNRAEYDVYIWLKHHLNCDGKPCYCGAGV